MTNAAATALDIRPALTQRRSAGLDITTFECRGLREVHLTVRPLPGEGPAETIRRLAAVLQENGGVVVRQEVFGSLAAHRETLQAMQRFFGEVNWPVTCVEGASCNPEPLAGIHVFAVAGMEVETVELEGRPIGRSFSDKWVRYVLLGDVRATDVSLS